MRDPKLAKLSDDPWLEPYLGELQHRADHIRYMENRLTGGKMTLDEFANAHEYFGLHWRDGKYFRIANLRSCPGISRVAL